MTGGIKIPVSADLSGVKEAVNDLGQSVKKTTGGDMGAKATKEMAGGMEKAAKSAAVIAQQLERAKKLQEQLGKQGFNMSADQAHELTLDYDFHRNNNASGAMKRKLQGVSLESLLGDGWRGLGSNEIASRRHRNDIMRQIGLFAPGGQPSQSGEKEKQRTFASFMVDAFRRAGAGVAGAALPMGGPGGAIAGSAVSEGAAIGGAAGAGRMLGGLGAAALAIGAIKTIGAVKGAITGAETESISYSDMLRRMGGTSLNYDELRSSVRGVGGPLGLNYADSAKLAASYTRSAGIDGMSGPQLFGELNTAGGFARSMGLDPEAGAGLMGALRHNKVSSGDADNRRFAMMIGEAVARAGVFTKADEVLSAVEGYTKDATRAALAPANVGGYIGGMSNLLNLRQAGLDPAGASSILGTVDHAFRSGGAGEAQRNFLLGSLQGSIPGMTAVDMGFMQDAGMFARTKDVFGEKSAAYGAADESTRARYRKMVESGGDQTFYDLAMGRLQGMSTDEQRKNMMGLFGLSDSQAAALQQATALQGGSLSRTMMGAADMYGLDPSKLTPGAARNLLDVQYGDPAQLQNKANYLRGQNLSADERKSLDDATANPGEANEVLKHLLIKLGTKYGNDETAGDVSRQNLAKLSNLSTDVATKLIPMTNAIREAIVATANVLTLGAFKDKYGKSEKAGAALDSELEGSNFGRRQALIANERRRVLANPDEYTQEYRDRIEGEFQRIGMANTPVDNGGNLPSGRATRSRKDTLALAKKINEPSGYDAMFKRAAERYGVDWQDLKQIGVQESGLRSRATNKNSNGTYDQGVMQLNSRYHGARGIDFDSVYDPETNINTGAAVWAEALKRSKGDVRGAFRRYNGSGSAAEQYADNAMALRAERAGTPLPAGAQAGQGAGGSMKHQVEANVNISLTDPAGRPRAHTSQVQAISAPRAAGVR